jgi:very-short-patch-repair endonuclease
MDDAPLLELAGRQHGVITDAQARDLGYSAPALWRRIQNGSWARVFPGVVRSVAATVTLGQRAMAAVLWASPDAVASHTTAAGLWRLDGVNDPSRPVEVTLPRPRDRRSDVIGVHRTTEIPAADRDNLHGIAVTSATRTLIDLAGFLPLSLLELAVEDAFRRRLTSPLRLEHRLEELAGSGRIGSGLLRALLAERRSAPGAVASSGSAAEVRLERLLVRSGLPRPVRQHPITHEGRTIRVDLAYPDRRLAIEFDSVRWHTGRARLENDADRRNLLRSAGWQLVTVTASMLASGGRMAVDTVTAAHVDLAATSWGDIARQARGFSP